MRREQVRHGKGPSGEHLSEQRELGGADEIHEQAVQVLGPSSPFHRSQGGVFATIHRSLA
jgi:hypothetical protein